jgi:hypothetical protein
MFLARVSIVFENLLELPLSYFGMPFGGLGRPFGGLEAPFSGRKPQNKNNAFGATVF